MSRSPAILLLCLVPLLFAGEAEAPPPAPPVKVREECGIVPGERYWITTRGLIFPDGTLREDWKNCRLMEGITLSILVGESPLVSPEVTEQDRTKNRRVEVVLVGS